MKTSTLLFVLLLAIVALETWINQPPAIMPASERGYYPNGCVAYEYHEDANHNAHGLQTEWYGDGVIMSQRKMEHGAMVWVHSYRPDGTLRNEIK